MLTSLCKNLSLGLLFCLVAGCALSNQITKTQRSSIEQALLIRALERAMAGLDTQKLKDKTSRWIFTV